LARASGGSALLAALAFFASALIIVVSSNAQVEALPLTTASQVAAGGRTTCAVMTGGDAYCWGDNSYGQFGDGTTTSSATPVLVSGGYKWSSISTEFDSNDFKATTCGVTTGGVGYCWGYNGHGEIGDGTTTSSSSPVLIAGGYTWANISVGWLDTCGVTTTGVGYCWGANWDGEDGDGTSNQHSSPALVSGSYTWSSISAGGKAACGVTTANVGYCWGDNFAGEVGDGGTTNHSNPALVLGGYSWTKIVSGAVDSCGVTTTGVGYCWGANFSGENGDGSSTQHTSPTLISGGITWLSISVAGLNTCGLASGGTAYCWGQNAHGEDGDGTTTQHKTPAPVAGSLTFTSVSAGDDYATADTNCGIGNDGIIYCWGYNNKSQIGDGTTNNQSSPTEATQLYVTANTTLSVTIDPTFTFTVGSLSSACNGESNFVSSAGSANAVVLGHVGAASHVAGGQTLTAIGNSGNGFTVYIKGTQASQNLRSGGHNWADASGTYSSPAPFVAGEQFGYTYHDSTASSSVSNPAPLNFIALDSGASSAIMGSLTSESGTGCVSYQAQTSGTTPAGAYSATVIYTAVPAF
jgi:alpha-tubulin suppressor-like RCC1 family protein